MTAIDTNILFAWLNRGHEHHASAASWIQEQSANPEIALCELSLIELYGLLRNEVLLEHPLASGPAVAIIQRLRNHPHWELLDYPGGIMEKVWEHAGAPHFARRRIFDVRLALALRHHGVTELATANIRDFSGFGFSRVWNPLKSF